MREKRVPPPNTKRMQEMENENASGLSITGLLAKSNSKM